MGEQRLRDLKEGGPVAVMQGLAHCMPGFVTCAFLGSESSSFHQILQRMCSPEFKEHWHREGTARKNIQESVNHPFNVPHIVEPLPDLATPLCPQSSGGQQLPSYPKASS